MKTRIIFLLFALLSLNISAQNKAGIKFDTKIHDYGQIKEEGGKAKAVFNFSNNGTAPLTVHEVKTSCGCITAEWTKTAVAPGQKGTVTVYYDPFRRPGKFEKSIWVKSNAVDTNVTLTIKGEVLPRVKTFADSFPVRNGSLMFSNKFFSLRQITNKETRKDTMWVYNASKNPITLSFKPFPEFFTCTAIPETLKPKSRGKLILTYNAAKRNDYGLINDYLTLVTNDSIDPEKIIQITATINEDFSKMTPEERANAAKITFVKEFLDYPDAKEGDIVKQTFEFTNTGKSKLYIRKAAPAKEDCEVTVSKTEFEPGESGTITISFDTKGKPGQDVRRTVLLTTNDPGRSFIILVIKGKVLPR